jgi:hypothetical protein
VVLIVNYPYVLAVGVTKRPKNKIWNEGTKLVQLVGGVVVGEEDSRHAAGPLDTIHHDV